MGFRRQQLLVRENQATSVGCTHCRATQWYYASFLLSVTDDGAPAKARCSAHRSPRAQLGEASLQCRRRPVHATAVSLRLGEEAPWRDDRYRACLTSTPPWAMGAGTSEVQTVLLGHSSARPSCLAAVPPQASACTTARYRAVGTCTGAITQYVATMLCAVGSCGCRQGHSLWLSMQHIDQKRVHVLRAKFERRVQEP